MLEPVADLMAFLAASMLAWVEGESMTASVLSRSQGMADFGTMGNTSSEADIIRVTAQGGFGQNDISRGMRS